MITSPSHLCLPSIAMFWLTLFGFAAPCAQGGPQNPLARPAANPLDRGASRVAAANGLRFTLLSVRDPGINNIEAVSFLVPAGWRAEGGVQWFPHYSILANLLMRITDPQTGAQIQFLPIQNFTWIPNPVVPMQVGTNYMGCIYAPPIDNVPQLVETFYAPQVLPHLRGLRPAAVEDLTKVAAEVQRMNGGQSQVRAQRVRYQFVQNGQPWEEDVYATLVYTNWQMGTFWTISSAYSFRAPRGTLDRLTPVMATTINTVRLNQEWWCGYMYVQQLFNNRMNQGIRDAAAISQTITRNSEEIRRMFADSYRQTSEAMDRVHRSYSEYIRGVETYTHPYEAREVQLPSGYNDVWVSARGEYVLSNDAGFNPNVGDTSEWRRMPTAP